MTAEAGNDVTRLVLRARSLRDEWNCSALQCNVYLEETTGCLRFFGFRVGPKPQAAACKVSTVPAESLLHRHANFLRDQA